jgi:hypothetical protein
VKSFCSDGAQAPTTADWSSLEYTPNECRQSAGPMPETHAARIVLRLATALGEAHDRGLGCDQQRCR